MADYSELEASINSIWEQREHFSEKTKLLSKKTVEDALHLLGQGKLRIAEKTDTGWQTHEWLKKAVLLSFRINDNAPISGGPGGACWYDKVPSRFQGMADKDFKEAGFRAVPGCFVRASAYIAPQVVLMPSFVNVGAYIGQNTMIDIWATVGSCAQIGNNCHISANAMIGGVLEPLQSTPVIIEDNCFIGACSGIAEGVIVETGSVISMGVAIGASTKIIDRDSGETFIGRVPAYSVVVSGALPGEAGKPALSCAVIVKRVDEKTRARTSINELLRS